MKLSEYIEYLQELDEEENLTKEFLIGVFNALTEAQDYQTYLKLKGRFENTYIANTPDMTQTQSLTFQVPGYDVVNYFTDSESSSIYRIEYDKFHNRIFITYQTNRNMTYEFDVINPEEIEESLKIIRNVSVGREVNAWKRNGYIVRSV